MFQDDRFESVLGVGFMHFEVTLSERFVRVENCFESPILVHESV